MVSSKGIVIRASSCGDGFSFPFYTLLVRSRNLGILGVAEADMESTFFYDNSALVVPL